MNTLIIDNYDSFTYNLVQYVGELGGKPVVFRNREISCKQALALKPGRIIISPGPGTPTDPRYFGECVKIIQNAGEIPILGVCLGHQGIAYAFGGKIIRAPLPMHGKNSIIRHDGGGIFSGVPSPFEATRYHSLVADPETFPEDLEITAESDDDLQIMGLRHARRPVFGVQFHPEAFATGHGKKLLKNFLDGKF
ncbi:MAG: aminodeoxychorismate/anthranilate synthase component II [Candidatus Micrarchaeia archaeon]|jgi:anthranilate synthase component 2